MKGYSIVRRLQYGVLITILCFGLGGMSLAQDDDSTVLRIAAAWEGAEAEAFQVVLDTFTEKTGIEVIYEPDSMLVDNIVKSGFLENPADVAMLPRPGVMRQLAISQELVPLDNPDDPLVDPDVLRTTLNPIFIRLGTFENQLYGLMVTSRSKSTIWYHPESFEANGFEIPQTWKDLKDIADAYIEAGEKPFALGGGDGWTLTDWFENIFVRMYGPSDYASLFVNRTMDWSDSQVQAAFAVMADMLLPYDERLADGVDSILTTTQRDAVREWLEGDAAMYYEGGFVHAHAQEISPDLTCGEDYAFFTFPSINPDHGNPLVGSGELAVVFNDTEAVREFMNFIASPEGATTWVTADVGSIISPNLGVHFSSYDDECSRSEARQIQSADTFLFDGSDLMPGIFGEYAFFVALQDYLIDPGAVSQIMEYLVIAESKS